MSNQAAHLTHAQTDFPRMGDTSSNKAFYTFTGGLHGAGIKFTFSIFALAQGKGDSSVDVDTLLRDVARRLLRDIYLPMIPWQATDRPNPFDALTDVMAFDMEAIKAAVIAVIINNHIYFGWQGESRVYLLSADTVEPLVSEDGTSIAAHTISEGQTLLLCGSSACQDIPTKKMLQILEAAPSLQTACDQLVETAAQHNAGDPPPILMIRRFD